MKIGLLFWILMLLWLVFGLWMYWPASTGTPLAFGLIGGNLLLFLVIGLLGWKVFGSPVQE
jgi:phosphate/sulfate permease